MKNLHGTEATTKEDSFSFATINCPYVLMENKKRLMRPQFHIRTRDPVFQKFWYRKLLQSFEEGKIPHVAMCFIIVYKIYIFNKMV